MTTRYSKRKPDGTFEHYDTREAMEAADVREHIPLFSFSLFFAFFGFIAGGVVALIILSQFDTWPTFIRFLAVLGAATAVGYIIGKIGQALFYLWLALIAIGIVGGIAALVWHLL